MSTDFDRQSHHVDTIEPQHNRRAFLKATAILAGTCALEAAIPAVMPEKTASKQPNENNESRLNSLDNSIDQEPTQDHPEESSPEKTTEQVAATTSDNADQESASYLTTALQSTGSLAGNLFLQYILKNKLGLNIGNAVATDSDPGLSDEQQLDKIRTTPGHKLFMQLAIVGLAMPTLEEVFCRGIPSMILDKRGVSGTAWKTGIATSAVFSAAHSYNPKTGDMKLPVVQFNSGMWAWWLQRNRGFGHAAAAHIIHNSIVTVPATLGVAAIKSGRV